LRILLPFVYVKHLAISQNRCLNALLPFFFAGALADKPMIPVPALFFCVDEGSQVNVFSFLADVYAVFVDLGHVDFDFDSQFHLSGVPFVFEAWGIP
jgi:hypothetical protein